MTGRGAGGEQVPGRDRWSEARAEGRLRSLELFGMRFGLERMRRMMTALGSPERAFDSIQVLGTNGKSSTTRMTAAILHGHGLRTGAYLSPHLTHYRERILIDTQGGTGGQELGAEDFSAAVARADHAAQQVNRTLAEDDHVTQFELLTAAAFWQMARADVEVAVVEAGLGGRYDATSVIDARVTVLTNVGLEHTRWLGPTIGHIAEEKLAVVRPGAPLVLGAGLAEQAMAVAQRMAAAREAPIVLAEPLGEQVALRSRGRFQRRNLALARAAAGAYLATLGRPLEEAVVAEVAASLEVPGRLQVVSREPLTILDGAHNPDAVAALVESLPDVLEGRQLALVLGVLDDKDATAMLSLLMPMAAQVWFTAPPSARALPPAALASQARQLGYGETCCEPRPERALAAAVAWASDRTASDRPAAVLATGSVYLVGGLLASATLVQESSAERTAR